MDCIDQVNVGLLLLTVTDVSTTWVVVIFIVKVSCIKLPLVIDLIGSTKSRCYWSSVC